MKFGTRLLLTLALPLSFACSTDQTSGLGTPDGAIGDAIAFPDATLPPTDAQPTDGTSPVDAGPGPGDAEVRPDADVPPPPPPDAGMQQCRNINDCFRALGRPPACPDGAPSNWACEQNICVVECQPAPVECLNDCDCPFELSCARGECRPLNRNNFCCANPTCRPGDRCIEPDGSENICGGATDGGMPPGPDAGPGVDAGPSPVVPVGAACMDTAQCNGGFCLDGNQGFIDGYCTERCNQSGACPMGAACQEFGPREAFCLDECATSMDCRTGYECLRLGTATSRVCFPLPPGSGNPAGDPVGSACISDNDCVQGLTCLADQGWPNGYCTESYCDPLTNPCPAASACYAFPGSFSLCLADCPSGGSQSTCRTGYYCLGPTGRPGGCLPN